MITPRPFQFIFAILLFTIATLHAQIPDGFNPGADNLVYCTAVQPDGKILAGGAFTTLAGQQRNRIARLLPDGTLDEGFNPGADQEVWGINVQMDGRILVTGKFTTVGNQVRNSIARLNSDGSLDTAFNPVVVGAISVLHVQRDGRILIGGTITSVAGQSRSGIARLNADGSLDTAFNPGANGVVSAMVTQSDGRILVAGDFTTFAGQPRNRIARLNSDGSLDISFRPNVNGWINLVAAQPDRKILIAGNFTTIEGISRRTLARLNADGSVDPSFNPQFHTSYPSNSAALSSMALQADGRILVSGWSFWLTGVGPSMMIARLNPDGTFNMGVQTSGISPTWPTTVGSVASLGIHSDGKVLVAGHFTSVGSYAFGDTGPVARNRIARLSNAPATQTLEVSADGQIDWYRSGSAPEVEEVAFDVWNGSNWVSLGPASRVAGGWQITGASLPPASWIRARGRSHSGSNNGSSGVITHTASYSSGALADIDVTTESGAPLVNNVAALDFGKTDWPTQATPQTLTITNAGDAALSGLAISVAGLHAADFSGSLGATSLAPGQSTTLVVVFTPQGGGLRGADLRIASNDGDESPFTISLRGQGIHGDATFRAGPIGSPSASPATMAVQPDGKILVGGAFTSLENQTRHRIARLHADGGIDASFDATADGAVLAIAIQTDGRIIVGGEFREMCLQPRNYIARLNPDGSLDSSFSPSPSFAVHSLAIQADGKILLGGNFTSVDGYSRRTIARLNPDGRVDTTFSPATDGIVDSLVVQEDGKILIGGNFRIVSNTVRDYIARLNANGSVDTSFHVPGVNNRVRTLNVQTDGKILMGGDFTKINSLDHNRIARLNWNGSLDATFNPGANNRVNSMVIQADGKILASGSFTVFGGQTRNRIARMHANGSLDATFDPGANGSVTAMAMQEDGRILAIGDFSMLGGQARNRIARLSNNPSNQQLRVIGNSQIEWITEGSAAEMVHVQFEAWNGSTWVSQGFATRMVGAWRRSGLSLPANSWVRARGRIIGGYGSSSSGLLQQSVPYGTGLRPDIEITLNGDSPMIAGKAELNFGTVPWQETAASQTLTVTNSGGVELSGMTVQLSGADAGDFNHSSLITTSLAPGQSTTLTVGFTPLGGGLRGAELRITSNDMDESSFLISLRGEGAQADANFALAANSEVRSIVAQPDGGLLVSGEFNSIGGVNRSRIARIDPDGTLNPTLNIMTTGAIHAMALQLDGKVLFGGFFTEVERQPRSYIGRLNPDGSLDPGFNPGADNEVAAFAVQEDGKILVGGYFTQIGGQARRALARLHADGNVDMDFNPRLNGPVRSIEVLANGKIVLMGDFGQVDNQTRYRVARLHADGTLDPDFNGSARSRVESMVVQADGKVILGETSSGTASFLNYRTIYRLNTDGTPDATFDVTPNGDVNALALQADGKILMGGDFTAVNGHLRERIARLNPDGTLDMSFDPGANGKVVSLALQSDGQVLVAGSFTFLAGEPRGRMARLANDTSFQALEVTGTSQIDWHRGGSAPELGRVIFERWNGSAWVNQVAANRVSGGWQMSGLDLPASSWVRARGIARAGRWNGSTSVVSQLVHYGNDISPDIAVEDDEGIRLSHGDPSLFGPTPAGEQESRIFTVCNTGPGILNLGAITLSGDHAGDFSLTTGDGTQALSSWMSKTITVTFKPGGSGLRNAILRIATDDPDEPLFSLQLTGSCEPHPSLPLKFASEFSGSGSHVDSRQLFGGQHQVYEIAVPATVAGLPVLGWILDLEASQGSVSLEVHPASAASGSETVIVGGHAVIVPPLLTLDEKWHVRVKAVGDTHYTLTSRTVTTERPVWRMPVAYGETFGDSGIATNGSPLAGDQGMDLTMGKWHFFAIDVPEGNGGLLWTQLEAISGNPDLYIREDGVPTISHDSNGNEAGGSPLYQRQLTATVSESSNWVPLDGRTEKELRPGRWYLGVRAAGNTGARYRLKVGTGQVIDLALEGGSLSGQTLAENEWNHYRFTLPEDSPENWEIHFSEQAGDVVMWLRDTVPPGQGPTNGSDPDSIKSWSSDAKNQGPYSSVGHGLAGSHRFNTPPLRPGHVYFVGIRSETSASFSISSSSSGGSVGTLPSLDFYNGVINASIPAESSVVYRIPVPQDATQLRWTSTHPSTVQLRLEQGSLPSASGDSQHFLGSGANSVLNQALSATAWPWKPGEDYYLRIVNRAAIPAMVALTIDGRNQASEDLDDDGLPDIWERHHFDAITANDGRSDPDHDGLVNSVEFVLGGNPVSGQDGGSLLPKVTLVTNPGGSVPDGSYFLFTYRRVAGSTLWNPRMEFATELAGPWTAGSSADGVVEVVTPDHFTSPTPADKVDVFVPRDTHSLNGKLFGRLRVELP